MWVGIYYYDKIPCLVNKNWLHSFYIKIELKTTRIIQFSLQYTDINNITILSISEQNRKTGRIFCALCHTYGFTACALLFPHSIASLAARCCDYCNSLPERLLNPFERNPIEQQWCGCGVSAVVRGQKTKASFDLALSDRPRADKSLRYSDRFPLSRLIVL